MELRQLRYFLAIRETGSFTRAAEACFVSQSAVSQQVRALEDELGFELLRREGRSVSLTPAGEHFGARTAALLDELEDARYEAEGIARGYATTLAVGYLNRYEGWEFQAAVAAFAARHPHVPLRTVPGSHDSLYRLLLDREVDLLFSDRRRSLNDDYENLHLFDGWTSVEVSEVSRVAWARELRVTDLASLPCILIASPEQEPIEREYYRDVLGFRSEFLFARSREEGRTMVAGNQGFMPVETRAPSARGTSAIRRIPLVGERGQLRSEYYAFWPKTSTNPFVREFAEILAGLFEQPEAAG